MPDYDTAIWQGYDPMIRMLVGRYDDLVILRWYEVPEEDEEVEEAFAHGLSLEAHLKNAYETNALASLHQLFADNMDLMREVFVDQPLYTDWGNVELVGPDAQMDEEELRIDGELLVWLFTMSTGHELKSKAAEE